MIHEPGIKKNCDKTSIYEQSVSSLKAMRSTLFWTLKVNETDAASILSCWLWSKNCHTIPESGI